MAQRVQTHSDWMPVTEGRKRSTGGISNSVLSAARPHVLMGSMLVAANGSGYRFLSPSEVVDRLRRERVELERDCKPSSW